MSIKETLERFREKFKSKTCDCDSICEIHKIEEYEQFITEEIKLAMEEIIPKKYVSKEAKFVDVILYGEPKGYNKAIKKINSNISKYFEV